MFITGIRENFIMYVLFKIQKGGGLLLAFREASAVLKLVLFANVVQVKFLKLFVNPDDED